MEDVVKKGDFVKIDFVGKTKEDDKIIDTTHESVAKEAGIYNDKLVYRPLPVIVGEGLVIKGLDEALEGKKVGEEFEVEIPPEKAFGPRDPKLLITVTESDLLRLGVRPEVGKTVRIPTARGVLTGRIVTISGGRVTIDFNHPLAGKTLVYKVKIVEKAKTPEEKLRYILELLMPKKQIEVSLEDNVARLKTKLDQVDAATLTLIKVAKELAKKHISEDLKLILEVDVE
jgi:FKBP-type peptidyl-prolyl cis-trans isomerase 2